MFEKNVTITMEKWCLSTLFYHQKGTHITGTIQGRRIMITRNFKKEKRIKLSPVENIELIFQIRRYLPRENIVIDHTMNIIQNIWLCK